MVRVDDHEKIRDFVDLHFRLLQQTNCKIIAKAWIAKREPQKQTTHPYNGRKKREGSSKIDDLDNVGESTKPEWWPPTEGWPQKGCRHREPDHIKKSGKDSKTCAYGQTLSALTLSTERLILLKHLLFSTKPNTSWTLAHLRQATKEVSHKLKPFALNYLQGIYSVWERYQRYEEGEIGECQLSLHCMRGR